MITSKEANSLLGRSILKTTAQQHCIEDSILAFAIYTRQSAQDCDISKIKKCMSLLQELYVDGDDELKQLIERVYIPAVKHAVNRECAEGRMLQIYIPAGLYPLYVMHGYKNQ